MMAGEEPAPGIIAMVATDGSVRQVADYLQFPNGMAVTPDNSTLIVAESYAKQLTAFDIAADGDLSNRRIWAEVDGYPDGISSRLAVRPGRRRTGPTATKVHELKGAISGLVPL
jgi:sugar lactone lactonase YvrE